MIFLYPSFLFGLFALVIPIIVHLFNFRKYKIFYFSNTQFLQSLQQQTKHQSQVKKLIVLALRLLAITAIVMAFARPYIPKQDKSLMLQGKQYVGIYIDNSFSMEGLASRGTLLDEAREKAISIAEAFAEDDKFMLITNDFEAKHTYFFSKEAFKKEVNEVQISAVTRSLHTVVQYAYSMLEELQGYNKHLFLISDYQQSTASLEKMSEQNGTYVNIVPLKANKVNNVYIDTLWFDAPVFTIGQTIDMHVILKNSSEEKVEKLPVKLFVNASQRALATADIPAGGLSEVSLHFSLFEAGIQQVKIEIADYPISFDDKLYVSFYLRPYYRILDVYGEKESPYLNALFAEDSTIQYQAVSDRNIDYAQLKYQDLIVLDQIKEQSSGFMQAMENYVREGGNVLFIPSVDKELVMSNLFNRKLQLPNYEALDTQSTRIASINVEHNLYKNIFEKQHENMHFPSVFRYYRVQKAIHPQKESLLVLENEQEFLSVQSIDRGKVYLLSVPLNDNYSEFQKHALFVPSLYNMAILSAKQQEPYYVIGENQRIVLPNIEIKGDNVLEIAQENGKFSFIPEIRPQLSLLSVFVHDQIKEAGHYVVKHEDEVLYGLSFNYNRKESDMQCFDKKELENQIETYGYNNYRLLNFQNKSTQAIVNEIQAAGMPLWSFCILLALLFLLAEIILLRLWKP